MELWLLILAPIYIGLLAFMALRSRRKNASADDFIMGGSKLGLFIGFMTTAATLFSVFTLMGMPNFFRVHGVGSWIFLAVSDGAMIFMIVWFGYFLRKKTDREGFNGIGGLLSKSYESSAAGILYFIGIFIFLTPYVALQVKGIAYFLWVAFPDILPVWAWATLIVVTMLIYSETGGLKAIIYADVMQGILLMIVVWIVAISCIYSMGGIGEMFNQVENANPALLSTPGPKNLLTPQFLFASMLAIIFIPITQPQVTTRLVIIEDIKKVHRMAVALGVFAMLVILPTIFIGLYGALNYSDMTMENFLANTLLNDQLGWVAAAAIIGLIAAAVSTSDSQIFALGSEFRSLLSGDEKKVLLYTKIAIGIFAFGALVFSLFSSDELALLAQKSFAGTALLGPMVLAAVLSPKPPGKEILIFTGVGLSIFVAAQLGVIPGAIAGYRLDWVLLIGIGILTALSFGFRRSQAN